jgi:hypothetical protein
METQSQHSQDERSGATGRKPWSTPVLVNYGQMTASTRIAPSIASDRRLKTDFAPVDVRAVLAKLASLPIETWSYKTDDPSVRHIGPMAQDFAAAFQVGEDDRHIHAVDSAGVAFAAIQGLLQAMERQRREIATLQAAAEQMSAELETVRAATLSRPVLKTWASPSLAVYGRMMASTRTTSNGE